MKKHDTFIKAVKDYALVFADEDEFILRSGMKSLYYLDCRKLTTCSEGVISSAAAILREGLGEVDAIGGPCVGADYVVGALLLSTYDLRLRGFGIRKENKDYGNKPGSLVFGSVLPGDRVTVIEDVTSSGESLLRAINEIRAYGCEVVKAISLIDRLMGAKELMNYNHINFQPIITINDLDIDVELEKRGL